VPSGTAWRSAHAQGSDAATECACFFGAPRRAVDEADLAHAFLQQPVADGACAATGADHHHRPRLGTPARPLLAQVADEAVGVVVAAQQAAVGPHGDAADGADGARRIVQFVDDRHRRLLVRDRHVDTREAEGMQRAQRRGQGPGLDRQRHVTALQPVLREPVVVDHRRARMHHRPAHHAGQQELLGLCHRMRPRRVLSSREF
jgi:hypothetical protein